MKDVLQETIIEIAQSAESSAVSYYDYDSATSWCYHGDEWFHAASTIKVAVLIGLFCAVDEGRFDVHDRLPVRNRFLSLADGRAFRIGSSDGADDIVHSYVGTSLRLEELSEHMIARSSNLATNLILDRVGVSFVNRTLSRCGIRGIDLRRGVEDEAAFEAGLNNRVTSDGLVSLFRAIEERRVGSPGSCDAMLELLRLQEFRSGIPAGIPVDVRTKAHFAHKTGDISTVTHDAGMIYLPGRAPYVLAILTKWNPEAPHRSETVAEISKAVFQHLTRSDVDTV
jgi:beta-lactamase class A